MPLRIKEILTVTCLAAFIFWVSVKDNYTDVPIDRLVAAAKSTEGLDAMSALDGSYVRKDFGINVGDYPEFAYYGHESVMNSETLLILRLPDGKSADAVISLIEAGRKRDMELFKSYSPAQYELLSRGVVEQKGKYIIYVVSDNAGKIEQAIDDVLTGKE